MKEIDIFVICLMTMEAACALRSDLLSRCDIFLSYGNNKFVFGISVYLATIVCAQQESFPHVMSDTD